MAESARNTTTEEGRLFMVPVDSSSHSEKAFDWYLNNIYKPGDKVGIVHVNEPPIMYRGYGVWDRMSVDKDDKEWKELYQESLSNSEKLVEKFRKKAEEKGADSKVYLTTNTAAPGQLICDLASKEKAEGIVMGSRGLNLFRRTLLGSVSSYVMHHAHVPVTVTPPPPKPAAAASGGVWYNPTSTSFTDLP